MRADSRIREPARRCAVVAYLVLAVGFAPIAGAEQDTPDYSDWYQIEFIVFAQSSPRAGDEAWAMRELTYPDNMVSIDSGEARPTLLAQLADLQRFDAVFTDSGPSSENNAPSNEFLFEDRSRHAAARRMEERMEALRDREAERKRAIAEATANAQGEGISPVEVTETTLASEEPEIDIPSLFAGDLPQSFRSVPVSERLLNDVAGSITRSSRYRLLGHTTWRQPVREGESWPVLVQAGNQYGDQYEVDGTLTFRRSRYLHVDADLWFTRFAESDAAPGRELPEGVDLTVARDFPDLLAAARDSDRYLPIHTHRLGTSRRMRRGELHYLDHPYFGIIVQFERFDYEPEEEDEE